MKRFRPLLALAAFALVFPLAACSAMQTDMRGATQDGGSLATSESVPSAPFDGLTGIAGDSMAQAEVGPQASRSIVKSGSIEIEVAALDAGVTEVVAIAARLGGSISSQQVSQYGGSARYGYILIDVPADRFDDAFDELAQLGTVRSDQRSTDDVTEQHVDLTARVAALETSVARLNDLLASAVSTSDLLEIENMLSARQADLDGLKAQLKSLEGRVAESSVQVTLSEPSVLPGGGPQSFWEALTVGLASIGSFAASAVIVLGVALPWLVILAVIACAIVIPLRIRRKRRSQHPLPTDSVVDQPEN